MRNITPEVQTTHRAIESDKLTHYMVPTSDASLNWNVLEITGLFQYLRSPKSNLITGEIRSRITRWVGHAVRRGDMRNSSKMLVVKLEGMRPLQEPNVNEIKIKLIFKICKIIYVPIHSVNLCGSDYKVVESSYQYCEEFADSTQCQEFRDKQND